MLLSSSFRALPKSQVLISISKRSRHRIFEGVRRRQNLSRGFSSTSSQVESSSSSTSSSAASSIIFPWLVAGATVTAFLTASHNRDHTDCSGIIGVVGKSGNTRDYFAEGLAVLKNRGCDGVGIASIDKDKGLVISKRPVDGTAGVDAGDAVLSLVQDHYSTHPTLSPTGMAHTRWATQGDRAYPSNVHPHLDSSGKIALIHNGTLINGRELREELLELGYSFEGQTDSEVLAKLIGHYYSKGGISVKTATEMALKRCDGTWGLCILCADEPDELVVACSGSSLFIGLGDDRIYVASETAVFNRYTKNFIAMKDGEIGVLDADGRTLDLSRKQEALDHREDEITSRPTPYDHWTLKEIMDQPNSVGRALGFGARLSLEKVYLGGLDSNADLLSKIKHLYLAGCGSSLNAARYGERLLKHVSAVPGRVAALDAAESDSADFASPVVSGLIAVSQSGETADTNRLVTDAIFEGITTMGIVNDVGSKIARATKMGVYCHAGQENGVASTKTFTSQVTCLALTALWFRELRERMEGKVPSRVESERLKEALLRLPISLGMALKSRDQCKKIAERLKDKEHCFVLGKGFAEPIAYEGALKIKEISNLHAEGYSGGALKHGPFALIDNDASGKFGATPIILLILDDHHAHIMRTAAEEVKARGADVIIITDKPELARDLDENPIIIPANGIMTALVALMPLQLIAYELALLRGTNPDTPRNLAKYYR